MITSMGDDDGHGILRAFTFLLTTLERMFPDIAKEVESKGEHSAAAKVKLYIDALREHVIERSKLDQLASLLDVPRAGTFDEMLHVLAEAMKDRSRISEVDHLTPYQIRSAIYVVAQRLTRKEAITRVNMADFLREVLDEVFRKAHLKGRLNVGANRHFPRLLQYLREVEEETWWEAGQGLKIGNAAGRGRVAAEPTDPSLLRVTVRAEYLPEDA